MDSIAETAQVMLNGRGRRVQIISHSIHRKSNAHLFRGTEFGRTVRFLGITDGERLVDLMEISTSERKTIGRRGPGKGIAYVQHNREERAKNPPKKRRKG